MENYKPVFFDRFQCRAGACKHTCCANWEIDVDEESAYRYMTYQGELGMVFSRFLSQNDETFFLKLTENKKCPLLQENGLCRLIIEKGKNALCEVCSMHPRFFVELPNLSVEALGLCCEAVSDLLLCEETELMFRREGTEQLISFGQLVKTAGIAVCTDYDYDYQIENEDHEIFLYQLYLQTESVEPQWPELLEKICVSRNTNIKATDKVSSQLINKLYQYILLRQLSVIEDFSVESVRLFAQSAVTMILRIYDFTGNLSETVRMWSEEIEYSTKNVDYLMDAFERHCVPQNAGTALISREKCYYKIDKGGE